VDRASGDVLRGTAPSGEGGHVNVSPKGPIETLHVLGESRVAYLDMIGSGAETIATCAPTAAS